MIITTYQIVTIGDKDHKLQCGCIYIFLKIYYRILILGKF